MDALRMLQPVKLWVAWVFLHDSEDRLQRPCRQVPRVFQTRNYRPNLFPQRPHGSSPNLGAGVRFLVFFPTLKNTMISIS